MRAAGLRGRHPRAWRRTTVAGQRPIDAPDLIACLGNLIGTVNLAAHRPNLRGAAQ